MHSSKKALSSVVCFLLFVSIMSCMIIVPFLNSDGSYFQDSELRAQLAGTIDYVMIGASHGLTSFIPPIVDQALGCNSYNLSGSMMTLHGKQYLLEKEFARNPIHTVVLELSYDTLRRDEPNDHADGDTTVMTRLDSPGERIKYMFKYLKLDDWQNVYARELYNGLIHWIRDILPHNTKSGVDAEAKGFYAKAAGDTSLKGEDITKKYNSRIFRASQYRETNIEQFIKQVDYCKSNGARVIIAVVPVSDSLIWSIDGWDEFYDWAAAFSKEHGCEFYDFNLLKDRYEIFSDDKSYADGDHMSEEGAKILTAKYIETIQKVDAGEDVSPMFYESYEAMKADSPYMAALES